MEGNNDRFFGSVTQRILNLWDVNIKKQTENYFVEFYTELHTYLHSHFTVSQNMSINSILPLCLNREINFNEINNITTLLKIKVDADILYDEFCNAKEKINAQDTSSQKWVTVFQECKACGISLCFVMNIPGSNAHTE
ncbi:hypothetical protein PR048_029840 [Dryococelus australis]|uniref:Uncharacterized protein n=1 Tax=Dryococelus australis TaxID=614101 RepID=A0ABQ9G7A2_9NEOP|nr:hypothetical protein PR048_029840 [Dryococelus australis]